MSTEISSYEQQAIDFLKETGTTFKCVFLKTGFYFQDDTEPRDIYKITLKNANGSYTFKFGQSQINSRCYKPVKLNGLILNAGEVKEPTAYDVLTCLEKYGYDDFDDFCSQLGYDNDSRKAEKIYKAVCKEYENVKRLFTDEQIEKLAEIQ